MYLTVNVLPHPGYTSLKSVLDLYPARGVKVLSLEFPPVSVISFHGGEWVDWLIEIACQQVPRSPWLAGMQGAAAGSPARPSSDGPSGDASGFSVRK